MTHPNRVLEDEQFLVTDPGRMCRNCQFGRPGPCWCEMPRDLRDCECGARSEAGEPCCGCGEVLL